VEEARYKVTVEVLDKPLKISKEKMSELEGVVKGGIMSRMKKEAVKCPVRGETISFVECFTCENFLRRVKGEVECRGESLKGGP